MPDNAELSQPPRPERYYFRWVFLTMLVVLFASTAALFKWGDMESMPGFVKVWKLRGQVLVNQIKYGREHKETQDARGWLASELLAGGSYWALENQYRALLATEERTDGTDGLLWDFYRLRIADCLFLQGRKEAAAPLMRTGLKLINSPSRGGGGAALLNSYDLPPELAAHGRREEALSLVGFTMEQGQEVFKDDPAKLSSWEEAYQHCLQQINAPSRQPPLR